jgi:lipopolysaccharide/colanic/teichoic acid biosynthesis glycosyltransferase
MPRTSETSASSLSLRELFTVQPGEVTASSTPDPSTAREPDWDALEPRTLWYRAGRPVLDTLLLVSTLPIALPLVALVSLASMVAFRSWRRVFFIQPRVGHRGRVFQLVKFRTMSEPTGTVFEAWSNGDRARVTPFGRFLRSTHLDELPQLYNVLRGEMSFIGPRPEMVEVEQWASSEVPGFGERLAVKPGITGLAQVTQGYTPRDVEAYRRKLAINRQSIASLSLAGDLAILVRTGLWMLRGRGWSWRRASKG